MCAHHLSLTETQVPLQPSFTNKYGTSPSLMAYNPYGQASPPPPAGAQPVYQGGIQQPQVVYQHPQVAYQQQQPVVMSYNQPQGAMAMAPPQVRIGTRCSPYIFNDLCSPSQGITKKFPNPERLPTKPSLCPKAALTQMSRQALLASRMTRTASANGAMNSSIASGTVVPAASRISALAWSISR